MKKYIYEAGQKLLDRPTQNNYLFVPTVKITVIAENETEAIEKADRELTKEYLGTGIWLYDLHLVRSYELPVDWSYGYGDERGTGTAEDKAALILDNKR